MKIELPYYTTRDYIVLCILVIPSTLAVNFSLLAEVYTASVLHFILATFITGIGVVVLFIVNGLWAATMKERFPHDSQTNRRLASMLIVFFLLNIVTLFLVYQVYESLKLFRITYTERRFLLVFIGMCIINVFITLIMESIDRYEKWNASIKEADEITDAFKQTQLQGLKSQLNPHFLFNCLNSLSSLIQEDEEEAEKFLNEMSKVYRYMLRNEEDTLVKLSTELDFVTSYCYLLQARFGKSLIVHVNVTEPDKEKLLPPLALQILIENAFTQNRMSKTQPLHIQIISEGSNTLQVCNNLQPKTSGEYSEVEAGIDNLVYKYQLLGQGQMVIEDRSLLRVVHLPLMQSLQALSDKEVFV